jgi:hypothetical protein
LTSATKRTLQTFTSLIFSIFIKYWIPAFAGMKENRLDFWIPLKINDMNPKVSFGNWILLIKSILLCYTISKSKRYLCWQRRLLPQRMILYDCVASPLPPRYHF